MKNITFAVALVFISITSWTAVGDQVASGTLDNESMIMGINSTGKLNVTISPDNADINFESSLLVTSGKPPEPQNIPIG